MNRCSRTLTKKDPVATAPGTDSIPWAARALVTARQFQIVPALLAAKETKREVSLWNEELHALTSQKCRRVQTS